MTDNQTPEPQATEGTGSEEVKAVGTDQYGRQLFEVKCSACGKATQVPFKPSGNRPVYCRDCYMQRRRDRGPRR